MKRRVWLALVLILVALIPIGVGGYIGVTNHIPSFIKAYQSIPPAAPVPHLPLVTLLVSLGGAIITLAGLVFTADNVKWGLSFNAVMKLHEDEASYQHAEAKKLVSDTRREAQKRGASHNVYSNVRKYTEELSEAKYEELNKARRRLTTFWYKAAGLVALGVLKPKDIFDSVGPPDDILSILEPLETLHLERIARLDGDPDWQWRPWPPMRLVIYWYNSGLHNTNSKQWRLWTRMHLVIRDLIARYKQKGRDKEGHQLLCGVPARRELYDKSKLDIRK
jgi:hypothetical protein